ncbi:nucleosome assembly protein 1-like 1 [Mytilus galloprovincialis]|uniref:Nucleosome assembly protein 1-like 1 n=1 Tax=Mytilus galloprovincialis TaxID=29158 RepID=A0A8B6FLG6_MYTGA|nr:nucleosome assembly protein 1-like 1 [Mytilus galloprovincialis]
MADPESNPTTVEETDPDVEEVDEEEEEDDVPPNQTALGLTSQLMQNPQVLAALQSRMDGIVGTPSGYIQSLPKSVKRRIKALKKLQFDSSKIEGDFYKEVHELECKYATKYIPLFEKRSKVVTGGVEPTDDDCDWPSDEEKEDEKDEVKNKAKIGDAEKADSEDKEKKEDNEGADVKGIPSFWLTVFKNVDMLSEMIQDHDEPILNHLQDVKVKFLSGEEMGFTLEFQFESNKFFNNTLLTKTYTMRSEPDEADPFSFEGPEIIKCKGCEIDWVKGQNVTVKTVKKKQKHKGRGTTRTITKTVQNDSFFNFFSPPQVPEDESEMDEDLEALLAADFEIGHFIRERIVPRAVLYFTGEALENDDDFDEEEEETAGGKPEECKQQ